MRNIIHVTKANLRKGLGQSFSLMLFALIAAMLLNIGLLLMIEFGTFFDTYAELRHTPHYVLVEEKRLYSESQLDFIRDYPGVCEVETEPALGLLTNIFYNGADDLSTSCFLNVSNSRNMNDLTLAEGEAPQHENDICLPYMFKDGGGYRLGDRFPVTIGETKKDYTISGFSEEIMFGSVSGAAYQFYLSSQGYEDLLVQHPEVESVIIRARLEDPSDSGQLSIACAKEFFYQSNVSNLNQAFTTSYSYNDVKTMRTMMSSMTSSILVVFAVIIVFVSLLVIRFRINNSIEENMTNTGAYKALGYTGNQLLFAMVLQFCAIAFLGIVLGIAASYALLPLISGILETQTGLAWDQGFSLAISALTLALIVLMVLATTVISARSIRKIQPLTALRQGLVTHSFTKNHLPMDRSRGPLVWLLAVKSALQRKGQMAAILTVVAAVSFAAVAGLSVYANIGLHPETFAQVGVGEIPDATFSVNDPKDMPLLRDYLEKNEQTRKVFSFDFFDTMIDDVRVMNYVGEDLDLLESKSLYEGRYPKHDNEIAIGGTYAQQFNKNIGDTIPVNFGGREADYLIVGYVQMTVNGGYISTMTEEGMRRVQPDYRPCRLYVYLEDPTQSADYVEEINDAYGAKLQNSLDTHNLIDAQLGAYGGIFQALAFAIIGVTLLVILLVLYLMLKTIILHSRRELGIQKALGFTTLQLMNQFALYFIPIVALGVIVGSLAGAFGFNALFVALLSGVGIMTLSLPTPIGLTIVTGVGLVAVAYAFALLITWRIRKISAYSLVSD